MKMISAAATTFDQTNVELPNAVPMLTEFYYSTAQIEKSLFFEPAYEFESPEEFGETTILVVHGDAYILQAQPPPGDARPLTPASGLFKIVDLDAGDAP